MTPERLRAICEKKPGLKRFWKEFLSAANSFRPHWHLNGVRRERQENSSGSEKAAYEKFKEEFLAKALALESQIREFSPSATVPRDVGIIVRADS